MPPPFSILYPSLFYLPLCHLSSVICHSKKFVPFPDYRHFAAEPSHLALPFLNNETELLQRIAEEDQEAFSALFFYYQQPVSQVVMLYTKDLSVAEEVLQEVFLKVWLNRATLPDLKDFRSWLFIIVRNYIIDYLRRWSSRKTTETNWHTDTSLDPEEADHKLRMNNYQQLLQNAVNTLPQQQKAVFLLAREQQLTYDAIAKHLSLSPATVKTHMQRALQHIRAYLAGHSDIAMLLLFLLNK